jgi:hypothetical protein
VLHLDIRAQGLCWLSATVDGTRVVYRLMQPGERYTIEVHHNAVLRVGDPVAFAFSINGRGALARSGRRGRYCGHHAAELSRIPAALAITVSSPPATRTTKCQPHADAR